MSEEPKPIDVQLPRGGFARSAATTAVQESGLVELFEARAAGPFGRSAVATTILEQLADAVDLGLAAAAALEGVIRAEARPVSSFVAPVLTGGQARLVAAFQLVVTADAAVRRLQAHCPVAEVEGNLELDGVDELLGEADQPLLATRVLRLARRFAEVKLGVSAEDGDAAPRLGTALAAALTLLRRAVELFARGGELRALVEALVARRVTVAGSPYCGLALQAPVEAPAGLLSVWPEQIVGNQEYLSAGLRLARDVAGFDFARGRNPKKLNPVLFGLGSPGCGKTITAHAIGNTFLRYCRERSVPARFLVVRRTDWASSYQNASANNLVRLFRDEVFGFAGVCGVYWPDIDTAFASRASTDLRQEEKQNLGAVFGLFDGTLIPKNGKWFLICDANTMHMDEAAVSRIAQNPFKVEGPVTVADYVRLMRDILLAEVRELVPTDEAAWERIGARVAGPRLSGRAVENICTNVRTAIQDFEYPDAYFRADSATRQRLLGELSRPVDEAFIVAAIDHWVSFQAEANRRDEEARFEQEVQAVVRQLNAGRAAVERAAALGVAPPG